MKKINFLSNRRLLCEIHHSKMSYSYYESADAYYFDHVIPFTRLDVNAVDIDEATNGHLPTERYKQSIPTNDDIEKAIYGRADRIAKQNYDDAEFAWNKKKETTKEPRPKKADFYCDPADYKKEDVVIRIMTYEHIPLTPDRKKTPKKIADLHARCKFPPFKHYAFKDGEWVEVARSHWKGDVETGEFCSTHGRLTEGLGAMMIRFCQKYGTKGNWRGYSYADEMMSDALLQMTDAGLRYCESRGNNPFSYFTTIAKNQFTRVFNLEKKGQIHRDDYLELNGLDPSHTRQIDNELHQYTKRYEQMDKEKKLYDK